MEFQILDWKAEDLDIEIEEDDDTEGEIVRKYIIKCFGLTAERETVAITICDFTPYFYIKPSHNLLPFELRNIHNYLKDSLPYRFKNSIYNVKHMNKKDMWGFNNNQTFPFIRIAFTNIMAMKLCVKLLSKSIRIGKHFFKYKLYENNIEPFIRFLHCKNINPSGWSKIDLDKCFTNTIRKTNCKYDLAIKWSNVESLPSKETISPLIVASFDIECASSHGDFPLAIKKYEKTTRELIQACSVFKTKGTNATIIKRFISKSLHHIFNIECDDEMNQYYSKIHFKNPNVKVKKSSIKIVVDTIYDIVVTADLNNLKDLSDVYDCQDEVLKFKNAFNRESMKNNDPDSKQKESMFTQVNTILSTNFPDVEGDSVIQIGTTFHKYGSMNCYYKHIITLGTCDDIQGVDEIIQCETEQDVLLEWTKLIQKIDPDIITGYNIFGFDFQFVYDRSTEIGCSKEFCKLGSYKNHRSEIVHKCLSSSALGDNFLHFIDIEGRVLIDLMKVIQRDHNLDSYKLDNVASHFIQGNIHNVDGNKLKVDNILGLQVNSYVTLKNDKETDKYLITEIDSKNNIIHVNSNNIKQYTKWGLAKDDVTPNEIFQCQKGTSFDRARIAKYCVQDCALCNLLIIKLEIIANNLGMSNVCCVPLSYIFMRGQGVKIFSLVAKQCRLDHILIPTLNNRYDENYVENTDDDGYEGAIVLTPKPGIYIDEPISVMDYASLYPSSMISENISHDSLVLDEKYDNLPDVSYVDITYDTYEGLGDKKTKVGVKTCRYAQFKDGSKGILPRILMNLLKQRKLTRKRATEKKITKKNGEVHNGHVNTIEGNKVCIGDDIIVDEIDIEKIEDLHNEFTKAVLDGLQQAYKVTANSLYGQVGARTSPIYLKELAASTTATGRNLILKAKDFMEKNYDVNVIYGDTDSIFVSFRLNEKEGLTGKEALKKSIELSCKASSEFKKACLKAPHDLEYEKTFYPFVILSKKKYVGNLYEFDVNHFKQKSMGIVLKRRDNANIVKHVYGGIIDIILNECDVQKAVTFLKHKLQDLIVGKFPLDQLVISKTLKGEYKDPTRIAHKVLADRMGDRDPGSKPQVNDRIPYIYIINKEKGVLQGDKIETPSYIIEHNIKPDYGFYISNQIMKPVSQLLALTLETIPGYTKKHDPKYYEIKEKQLMVLKDGNEKKVQEKLNTLRMDEVEKILFRPLLDKLSAKTNGNTSVTDFFKVINNN
jgi:DNA polymerase elongation subunit (family B)